MKQKYDKYMIMFYIFMSMMAITSIAWSITKAYLVEWNVFGPNTITLNIGVGLIVGAYLIYFCLNELWNYRKHGKLIHGYDERNARVVSNSIRNAGLVITVLLMGVSYYYSLFNEFNTLLFSVTSISYVLWVGIIIFFISFRQYYKTKDL